MLPKNNIHTHTLIQQSLIEIFKSPKRFVFSLLEISFTFFSQKDIFFSTACSCLEEFSPCNIYNQHEFRAQLFA
jgi:hypothetical protein